MTTLDDVKRALEVAKKDLEDGWFRTDTLRPSLKTTIKECEEPLPWTLFVDIATSGMIDYWDQIGNHPVLPPEEASIPPGKDDTNELRLLRAGAHLFERLHCVMGLSSLVRNPKQEDWLFCGCRFREYVLPLIRSHLESEDRRRYTIPISDPDWKLDLPQGDDFVSYAIMYPKKSLNDPNRISYRDIPDIDPRHRIVTTPGRFLTKFFSHLFDKPKIAALAASFNGGDGSLKFARTKEDIIRVYLNGPHSCMAHKLSQYAGKTHPVAVYASPDLGVAYLERGGEITARTLVRYNASGRPYVHSRIYGDSTRISSALSAVNIISDEDETGFDGARLVKIHHNGRNYIMPYIDGYSVDEVGDHFVIRDGNEGEYSAKETCGLLFEDTSVWSEIEQAYIEEEDAIEISHGNFVSRSYADENLTYSAIMDEYIYNENVVEVNFQDRWSLVKYCSEYVSKDWRDFNAFYCEKTKEWWYADDFEEVEIESTKETWSSWAVENYGNPDDDSDPEDSEGKGVKDLPIEVKKSVDMIFSGGHAGLWECVCAYMEEADKNYTFSGTKRNARSVGDIVFSSSTPDISNYGIITDFGLNRDEVVLYFPLDGGYGHPGNSRGLFAHKRTCHWFVGQIPRKQVIIPVSAIPDVYEAVKKAEAMKGGLAPEVLAA